MLEISPFLNSSDCTDPALGNSLLIVCSGKAGPVALVERWTPRGERTHPGKKGFEARRALAIYEPPGGYGHSGYG